MRHLEVLEKIRNQLEPRNNVVAMLLFGSVADGTYHEESDIDLSIIYKEFKPGFEFSTVSMDDIKIGFSKWSLKCLQERVEASPYRMYIFAHAKLQFDKSDEIIAIQTGLLDYFRNHPDVQRDWDSIADNYRREKESYGVGQTNIFDVYAELDRKYLS